MGNLLTCIVTFLTLFLHFLTNVLSPQNGYSAVQLDFIQTQIYVVKRHFETRESIPDQSHIKEKKKRIKEGWEEGKKKK